MVKALAVEPGPLTAQLPEPERSPRERHGLAPAELTRENRRHDLILAGLTLLFVFLLTSFPVLNSDVWLQLRTGQMIVNGEFGFGVEPFTYTYDALKDGRWVHTAWLWDTLVYGVYRLGEGAGLSLLRGLLMLVLGIVLFQIRRSDAPLLPVVLSLTLAFLVMTARLALRSELCSLVFTGLTLYLLWRPPEQPRTLLGSKLFGLTRNHRWVLLPPLFALWANCDYWFFLGPCMVLLYLASDILQGVFSRNPVPGQLSAPERRSLALVLVISTLACLLNPFIFGVFLQRPPDLSSEALELVMLNQPALRQGTLRGMLSPFKPAYFQGMLRDELWWRPYGLSLAEWCYYPLLLLSGLSFLFNRKEFRLWRLLLWASFLALSAWQAQKAAFFAVVAGPIMALNFQDWLASRTSAASTVALPWVLVGQVTRIVALVVILMLCFLTTRRLDAPTLQQRGRETALGLLHTRALGWSMLVDPSLKQSAEKLAEWQLPGRGFSLDWREQPSYLAFFAPHSVSFMDARLQLHGAAAREFFSMQKNLRDVNPDRLDKRATYQHYQWQDAFRKHDISHLIVGANISGDRSGASGTDAARNERLVDLLLSDEIENVDSSGQRTRTKVWELLGYVDGRTFILAWTGSPHYEQLKKLRFDPDQEAFRSPTLVPPADGPDYGNSPSALSGWLAGELNRPPLALDEGSWHETNAEVTYLKTRWQAGRAALMPLVMEPSQSMSGAGLAMPPLLAIEPLTHAGYHLAVRAARRAIAERPEYAASYYQLYQAYFELARIEQELGLPLELREAQMAMALREAVRHRPQEPVYQLELAQLYLRRGFGDLAVKHYEAGMRGAEDMGISRDVLTQLVRTAPELGHLQPLLARVPQESRVLADRRASFNARASLTDDPGERARFAMELGLSDEARQAMETVVALLRVQPSLHTGNLAVRQLLDLYLQLGYAPEMIVLLGEPGAPGRVGPGIYHQRSALAWAALGNYQKSVHHYLAMDEELSMSAMERTLLGVGLHTRGAQSEMPGSLVQGLGQLQEGQGLNSKRAEVMLQAGLIALEAGWTKPSPDHENAPALFRKAFKEIHPGSPQRPLAARYYRLMTNEWLD